MIRAIAVIVIAAMCAVGFGLDRPVQAAQNDAARQRAIAERLTKMKVGDIVKGQRADGTKFEGRLVAKTPESVTVDVYRRRAFRGPQRMGTETIAFTDLRDIKKPLSRAQQALIVAGVAVGACAVAASLVAANLDQEPVERLRSDSDEAAPGGETTETPATGAPLLTAP